MVDMVVSQMMKGPRLGRVDATKKQLVQFRRRHEAKITWVLDRIPRYSAAVAAVIVKSMIVHGVEKTRGFCEALQKMKFRGADDPAHLLWLFLLKNRGKNTLEVYQKTVCAAKAYFEDRTVQKLHALKGDIFEWDEDYTIPDAYVQQNEAIDAQVTKENQEKPAKKPNAPPPDDEAVLEEMRQAGIDI
jgi:hypothetical protein